MALYPFILDVLAPSSTLAQSIGESAIDLWDVLNRKKVLSGHKNQARSTWSLIILSLGFLGFVGTMLLSPSLICTQENRMSGIPALVMAMLALGFFLFYFSISIYLTVFILILAVVVVLIGGISVG